MRNSASSALEQILSGGDDGFIEESVPGAPGRKPAPKNPPKSAAKASARNLQAWRSIEDMHNERQLKKDLKEIYEDD